MVLHTPAQVLFAHLQRRQIERLIAQATDAQKELRADLLRTRRELDLMIHQVGVAVKESAKMPRIGPARRLPRAPLRATRIQTPPGARLARCATFLLTKDAYRRYVQPVIAESKVFIGTLHGISSGRDGTREVDRGPWLVPGRAGLGCWARRPDRQVDVLCMIARR